MGKSINSAFESKQAQYQKEKKEKKELKEMAADPKLGDYDLSVWKIIHVIYITFSLISFLSFELLLLFFNSGMALTQNQWHYHSQVMNSFYIAN